MNSKEDKITRENMVPTAGQVSGKETLIEIIRGEGPDVGLRLLIWNGKKATTVDRFTADDVTYVPLDLEPTIGRSLLLPTRAREYGSTRKLFDDLSALVLRVARLPRGLVAQVVSFIFATWLADRLPMAPLLWITASPTVATGPLLQLLMMLCRRALSVSELTTATFRVLPMELTPTIVTETSTITPGFLKALRVSSRPGTLAVTGDKLVSVFCAKVVISNQPLRDPAMAGFPIETVLAPSREYIPRLDPEEAERVASEFQAKLLMYRLVNYRRVARPDFDLGGYTAPTQELAHTLAACIVDDSELQSTMIPVLEAHDREIQVDRTTRLESFVIEALWAACHDSKSRDLAVTDLAKDVNTILAGRGQTQEVSPEMVGWKLRGLGLRTEFITGGRKGLKLPREIRERIHTLAASYGVRTLQQGAVGGECSVCTSIKKEKKTA